MLQISKGVKDGEGGDARDEEEGVGGSAVKMVKVLIFYPMEGGKWKLLGLDLSDRSGRSVRLVGPWQLETVFFW